MARVCADGGAPGDREPRRGRCAGRRDGRRARPGMAGNPAARGDRSRPRRRLQSQRHFGLRGRIGERVASEFCTVVDDGTIPNRRGSLNVDDEGTPTNRTVLIEDGILVGYMQDRQNARLMNMKPTGNGRRESYAHVPMPRMTNTFMLAGEIDARGHHQVGQARAVRGQLRRRPGRYHQRQIRLLGERGLPDRRRQGDAAGQRRDAHRQRSRRADARLDGRQRPRARRGIGTCGKDGQSVPVGVGLPTIRIDGITVGGTRATRGIKR